ncbi:hypothetical protein [Croceibacterium ferulae]|uniref:hypothetical protein n=1 Tax=Croceibacterium ferulae TaxID=1854641 RepID=UPI000EAE4307|nr:hypothetical protein [Croceibacterium ferulae]
MIQPDLFAATAPAPVQGVPAEQATLDLPAILERLSAACQRPRYCFMVLNLIAQAGGPDGAAGPYVRSAAGEMPVRDWLCDALLPTARRDPRRRAIADRVRRDLALAGALPEDSAAAERMVAEEVRERVRQSGRTNVSRAVSELVRAGLVTRHYQGWRVDHENRGAQRQAVYTLAPPVREALRAG